MEMNTIFAVGPEPARAAVPKPKAGKESFKHALREAKAPPGKEPPPDRKKKVAEEEQKTHEPIARSKKPDFLPESEIKETKSPEVAATAVVAHAFQQILPQVTAPEAVALAAAPLQDLTQIAAVEAVAQTVGQPVLADAETVNAAVNPAVNPQVQATEADVQLVAQTVTANAEAVQVIQPELPTQTLTKADAAPTVAVAKPIAPETQPASQTVAAQPMELNRIAAEAKADVIQVVPQGKPAEQATTLANDVPEQTQVAVVAGRPVRAGQTEDIPVGNDNVDALLQKRNFTEAVTPKSTEGQDLVGKDSEKAEQGMADAKQDTAPEFAIADATKTASRSEAVAEKLELSVNETRDVIRQIVRRFEQLVSRPKEVTIHLDPLDLGEITMKIAIGKEGVDARIEASNDAVRNSLQAQNAQLHRSLEKAGYSFNEITVGQFSLDSRDASQQADRQQPQAQQSNHPGSNGSFQSREVLTQEQVRTIRRSATGTDLWV